MILAFVGLDNSRLPAGARFFWDWAELGTPVYVHR